MHETYNGYLEFTFKLRDEKITIKEHRLNALLKYSLSEIFDKNNVIHHKNHCKLDNRLENLELMSKHEHLSLHKRGDKNPAKKPEVRKKLSESKTGRKLSEEHKKNLSKPHKNNSTGFYGVCKKKKNRKQGFRYQYRTTVDAKRKEISAVDILKLADKVQKKGFKWEVVDIINATKTLIESNKYNKKKN